jgi:tRNA(Arg) A34 adenosine deaminase TadA
MNDEQFMKLAIEEAKKSQEAGGAPIGAVLVKDGKVVATGWSLVWPKKDPSAHAETECMRNACQKLQTLDLSGCTLYSTLESCSMCLGCAGWSGLSRIVFGAYKEDVPENPYEISDYHAIEHVKRIKGLEIAGGVLREECKELMKNIRNWSPVE